MGKGVFRECRDVTDSARVKGVGRERIKVTDSVKGKGVAGDRRDVTDSAKGRCSSEETLCYRECKGGRGV